MRILLSGWGNSSYVTVLRSFISLQGSQIVALVNSAIHNEIRLLLSQTTIPIISWEVIINDQTKPLEFSTPYISRISSLDCLIIHKLYLRTVYASSLNHFFYLTDKLASHYLSLIDSVKPDLILWPEVPHAYGDYVLAALAKQLNIPSIALKATGMQGWKLSRAIDLNTLTHINCETSHNDTSSVVARLAEQYSLSSNYHCVPYDSEKKAIQLRKKTIVKNEYLTMSQIPEYTNCLDNILSLKRFVEAHESTDVISRNDIIVFLHFEPEANLCPLGGYYSDQLLFIRRINDWAVSNRSSVFIREHPEQLRLPLSGLNANLHWLSNSSLYPRNSNFLSTLLSFQAVRGFKNRPSLSAILNHPSAPSVASVNGNVLLQARIAGLHTVYAFKPWYYSEGMTYVDDLIRPLELHPPLSLESFTASSLGYVLDSDFMSTGDSFALSRFCKFLSNYVSSL